MEFVFLPLWCHLVNWGPAEADLVGFPGKIDLKMAHVGFRPALLAQHPLSKEVALAWLAAPGERVGIGSSLLWILPSAGIWLGNK